MANEWYCFEGEKRIGPMSSQQLKSIASDGTLKPSDPVWKEGMVKAIPAEKIKGLFGNVKAPDTQLSQDPLSSTSTGIGWYYVSGAQQIGPIHIDAMLELVKSNQLYATDLVWNESLTNWVTASEAPELSSAFRISVLNLFNTSKPNTNDNVTPAFKESIPQSQQQSSASAIRGERAKHKSSATPMIAAGVGGIVAGAAIASLLVPGTAQASSMDLQANPNEGHGIQGIVLDTNQDGVVDTAGADLDHDGQFDAIGVDIDGDGQVDAVGLDIDHDGNLDAYSIDTDHDGQLDTYGFDSDGDGQIDVIAHDYDEDGQIDDFDSGDMDF